MQQKTLLQLPIHAKTMNCLFLLAFLLTSFHSPLAQVFVQQSGNANPFNGIDAVLVAHPTFGDLDGDGDQDLIIGQTNSSDILYYQNTGTVTAPVYTPVASPIPYTGIGQYVAPDLGDVDGDGDLDAVIGNSDGVLFYFRNTGTPTAPVFIQQNGAENPFGGINFDDYLAPALGDLDGDGDLDLLVTAQFSGSNYAYYENSGTPTTPVYVQRTGTANPFNSSGAGGIPALGDIDKDGDLDLINGNFNGRFAVRLNIGTATAPLYVNRPDLLSNIYFEYTRNGRTSPDFTSAGLADVDGDGDLDIAVGLFLGSVAYLENVLQITRQPNPATSNVCPGSSVSSSIVASGDGNLAYQWYRNSRSTATPVAGQTSFKLTLNNVQADDAGLYYLLVTSAGGAIWSEPYSLTVSNLALTVTDPAAVCAPATVDLTTTVSTDIAGSTFAFFTDAAATQPLANPGSVAVSGTYYVRATSPAGCVSALQSIDVTISPKPTPTITANGPTTFCPGGSVVLTASEGASYLWSTAAITRSITVNQSGSYSVSVTTDAGCSATSDATTVTVTDSEKPMITACAPAQSSFADANCSAEVPDFTAYVNATDNCTSANDLKITQSPSAGTTVSTGSTPITITVKDVSGNYITCYTKFTVTDNSKPVITCVASQALCYLNTCNYTIPKLSATDNCGVKSIAYVISGATTRSGNGNNASGTFKTGISTITWAVTDASGNHSTCKTIVTVNTAITVTIPDVKALSSGVKVNTVYKGYAPAASITLTAHAGGGTSPYTYKWSNGAKTRSIKVNPASTTTYVVTVTDKRGCTIAGSKRIIVIDVRCGNKSDKVVICHKGKNALCIEECDVADHLKHGDNLGSCNGYNMAAKAGKDIIEEEGTTDLSIRSYPNPSNGQFSVQFNSYKAVKAEVLVLDINGAIAERRNVQLAAGTQTLHFDLKNKAAGLYLIKVIREDHVETTKVVIQR